MEAVRFRVFSALLPLLLAVAAFGEDAVSSVPALLREVALQYEAATDYVIRAETVSRVPGAEASTARTEVRLIASRPNQFVAWQRVRSSPGYELLLVASGSSGIAYSPERKLYAPFEPGKSELWNELQQLHRQLFSRFAWLDRLDSDARAEGIVAIRFGGKRVRCLRLVLQARDRTWRDTLWVDVERKLVWKSEFRRRQTPPATGEVVTTTLWKECRINEPPDPKQFAFTPPPDARRTNALALR